jgi:hypothetical protein
MIMAKFVSYQILQNDEIAIELSCSSCSKENSGNDFHVIVSPSQLVSEGIPKCPKCNLCCRMRYSKTMLRIEEEDPDISEDHF